VPPGAAARARTRAQCQSCAHSTNSHCQHIIGQTKQSLEYAICYDSVTKHERCAGPPVDVRLLVARLPCRAPCVRNTLCRRFQAFQHCCIRSRRASSTDDTACMSVNACIPCTPDRRTREDLRRRPVEGADRARHCLRAAQQLGQAHICARAARQPRPPAPLARATLCPPQRLASATTRLRRHGAPGATALVDRQGCAGQLMHAARGGARGAPAILATPPRPSRMLPDLMSQCRICARGDSPFGASRCCETGMPKVRRE